MAVSLAVLQAGVVVAILLTGGVTMGQVLSVPMLLVGIGIILIARRRVAGARVGAAR